MKYGILVVYEFHENCPEGPTGSELRLTIFLNIPLLDSKLFFRCFFILMSMMMWCDPGFLRKKPR